MAVLDLLARIHAQQGDLDRADQCWAEAERLAPGGAEIVNGRRRIAAEGFGEHRLHLGRHQQGVGQAHVVAPLAELRAQQNLVAHSICTYSAVSRVSSAVVTPRCWRPSHHLRTPYSELLVQGRGRG